MSIEEAIIGVTGSVVSKMLTDKIWASAEEKKTYSEKLEHASGDDIFKYILLINISALEGYVAQTRVQAQQSFQLSKVVSTVGFAILGIAIILSIYLTIQGKDNLNAAYLCGIAGVNAADVNVLHGNQSNSR